jgi:HK97 family phage major capsid protein
MSNELMRSLDDKRKVALAQAREIAERAAAGEERQEDEEAYVRANKDYDKYSQMMIDERKRVEEDRLIGEAFDKAAQHRSGKTEKARTWVDDVRDALNKKEARKGNATLRFDPDDIRPEVRTGDGISNLTTAASTVPTETLQSSLFRKLFDDVAILGAGVNIFRTADGTPLMLPRLISRGILSNETTYNATSAGEARVAEGGSILKTGEPTFDQVTFNAYKYGQILMVTRELLQDSVIDVQALLGELLGTHMSNYLAYDLLLGDGTGDPKGVHVITVAETGNLKTGGTTGNGGKPADVDELIDVQWELKPAYRRNAKWIMNDTSVLWLRKMKIGTEANHYVFEPGTADGRMDRILGHDLFVEEFMPNYGTGVVSIIYADMSKYYVRMVADLRVEWSTEYAWDTDKIAVKGVMRADGDTIDSTAFAGFKGAAS